MSDTNLKAPKLVRVDSIVGKNGLLPISESLWWNGVRSGRFPQPSPKISPNVTTWFYSDIVELIENGFNEGVE